MKSFILSICLLLAGLTIQAEELRSPNGALTLQFTLQEGGVPAYSLQYKGREVILPSRLGLELAGSGNAEFGQEVRKNTDPRTSLYDGFRLANTEWNSVDETW